jgi:hypothetical protein
MARGQPHRVVRHPVAMNRSVVREVHHSGCNQPRTISTGTGRFLPRAVERHMFVYQGT